jgi:hypothetical protein
MVLETRVLELTRENSILRAELYAIKEKFGLPQNQVKIYFLQIIKCSVSYGILPKKTRTTKFLNVNNN